MSMCFNIFFYKVLFCFIVGKKVSIGKCLWSRCMNSICVRFYIYCKRMRGLDKVDRFLCIVFIGLGIIR